MELAILHEADFHLELVFGDVKLHLCRPRAGISALHCPEATDYVDARIRSD